MRLVYLVMLVLYGRASSNTESCCRNRGVSEACSRALCRLASPPGDNERYTIFEPRIGCDQFLPEIAECIVDGRDSTECCRTNAIQDDENSCLGLCRGSPDGVNHWIRYQSCLSINLASMYSCILSSHSNTPTPPQLMRIASKTGTTVEIQWSPPAKHPELVHIYKVSGHKHEEVTHSTKLLTISLTNLKQDTLYSVYVVAHASDISRKSTPSDVLHFSTSFSDNVGVKYSSKVYLPKEASGASLACHLRMGVGTKMHMVWEKKVGSAYRRVDGPRFKTTTYASEEGPLVLVSALDIRDLDSSDFGIYKCHVRGNSNEYGEVHLVAHSYASGPPPPNPPETLLECCSRSVVRAHCNSVCRAGSTRERGLKPGNFLPRIRCLDVFQSLLRCTLSEMNNPGCCIRKKIPYHCLGMCDSNFELTTQSGSNCLEYQNEVRQCQAEVLDTRPEAVSNLHVKNEADVAVLNWERSENTEVYHIYHRRRKGPYRFLSTTKTTARVRNADEIVVLAVNAYGAGSANRIAFEDNEWIGNYD
ncbi:DB module [Oesophagostomum dentatum]|uniref:DB module n=1 Tax=Oesophagostomum dentatum TaxID=61180 RepID=A0A0B1TRM0_OESDE|nr:DB module [Oesophagostomum dentatum]